MNIEKKGFHLKKAKKGAIPPPPSIERKYLINISQYVSQNLFFDAKFEIIENFINLKGEHIKERTVFIGNNMDLYHMVIYKDPDFNNLLDYLTITDFYVTKSALGLPVFNVSTLLL